MFTTNKRFPFQKNLINKIFLLLTKNIKMILQQLLHLMISLLLQKNFTIEIKKSNNLNHLNLPVEIPLNAIIISAQISQTRVTLNFKCTSRLIKMLINNHLIKVMVQYLHSWIRNKTPNMCLI